jgi:hypothetical protein
VAGSRLLRQWQRSRFRLGNFTKLSDDRLMSRKRLLRFLSSRTKGVIIAILLQMRAENRGVKPRTCQAAASFFLSCALALIEILRKRIRLRAAEMTTFSGSPLLPEPLRFSVFLLRSSQLATWSGALPLGYFCVQCRPILYWTPASIGTQCRDFFFCAAVRQFEGTGFVIATCVHFRTIRYQSCY